mmetsp:Transcript_7764/g.24364  ORF Transcript_7764/g.24364 Transcript_7764/m.24364 type:complete len:203 (-) Transcript_7764:1500-2108(-)
MTSFSTVFTVSILDFSLCCTASIKFSRTSGSTSPLSIRPLKSASLRNLSTEFFAAVLASHSSLPFSSARLCSTALSFFSNSRRDNTSSSVISEFSGNATSSACDHKMSSSSETPRTSFTIDRAILCAKSSEATVSLTFFDHPFTPSFSFKRAMKSETDNLTSSRDIALPRKSASKCCPRRMSCSETSSVSPPFFDEELDSSE